MLKTIISAQKTGLLGLFRQLPLEIIYHSMVYSRIYIKDRFWHVGLAEYNRGDNINMIVVMWAIPKSLFSGTLSITNEEMHLFDRNYNWS